MYRIVEHRTLSTIQNIQNEFNFVRVKSRFDYFNY